MQEKRYSCLNGAMVLAERAAIPVADRGWRFGDGVFETIRLEHGVPYQWDLHMARLAAGLTALRIAPPVDDWAPFVKALLRRNAATHGYLRLSVSRGVGSRGYAPFPPGMPASWVIELLDPLDVPEKPCRLWLSATARIPIQCLPVQHKLAHGIGSTLALLEAQDHGCGEALQLTTEGFLCEAASANIFWIRGGTLFTPALDTGCLSGTTREALLRLSPVPTRAVKMGLGALDKAEAVFLSNCRLGIWPVAELQPSARKFTTHHPLLRQLSNLLKADRARYVAAHRKLWKAR